MSDVGEVILGAMLFGGIFFVNGIRQYFKKKLIEHTPTSKVRSIAMGFVELKGKVLPEKEVLKSPFTNSKCVYYKYKIEEYRKSGKHSRWVTIKTDSECTDFYLKDETGQVLIDPQKATIDIPQDFMQYGPTGTPHLKLFLETNKLTPRSLLGFKARRRYTEYYLAPNDQIYVLGTATSRPDSQKAVKNEDKIIIKRGTLNKTFYISDSSEKELLAKFKWLVPLQTFGGIAMFLFGLALLFYRIGIL